MGMLIPNGSEFRWIYGNAQGAQPANPTGTAITPGTTAGSYGSWANVVPSASFTNDVYGIYICFNTGSTGSTTRNILCEMGVDNTGGTNYRSTIPYLLASSAFPYITAPGGIQYYFPLFIKSGSSIAFRAMSNVATTVSVSIMMYGRPSRPELIKVGSYVDAFGIDVTNRTGTSVSISSSEGAWTQLGSATTRPYWWWQSGYHTTSITPSTSATNIDIATGNASFKKIAFENQRWYFSSTPQIGNIPMVENAYSEVPTGSLVYGRGQCSTTPTNTFMMAYALGG